MWFTRTYSYRFSSPQTNTRTDTNLAKRKKKLKTYTRGNDWQQVSRWVKWSPVAEWSGKRQVCIPAKGRVTGTSDDWRGDDREMHKRLNWDSAFVLPFKNHYAMQVHHFQKQHVRSALQYHTFALQKSLQNRTKYQASKCKVTPTTDHSLICIVFINILCHSAIVLGWFSFSDPLSVAFISDSFLNVAWIL